MEKEMKEPVRKTIVETLVQRSKHVSQYTPTQPFTWKEITGFLQEKNITLQDDDILEIGYDEGFNYPDNSKDPSYDFTLKRPRLETEAEFEKRKQRVADSRVATRKRRKELYLELKAEFENEQDNHDSSK
jgi:hypothetical protein